jgi:hypothetical protein
MAAPKRVMHGMKHLPEWRSWRSMRDRCRRKTNPDYLYYGGRGIIIDPAWDSFLQFYADMGPRPEGTTLDRIDPDGNYEPGNCRWATSKEQADNRRPRKPRENCLQGHAFTEENTFRHADGRRECRTCRAARGHQAYLARKAVS